MKDDPAMTAPNGIPTPASILRRRIVLRVLKGAEPGRVLEIGCGRGDLLARLASRGWEGVGLEIAPEAAAAARRAVQPFGPRMTITEDPRAVRETFPLVLALEVLEHVRDDEAELQRWLRWMAPGGRLVVTVPAHERYWTGADEFGGHVRRYERIPLRRLMERTGLEIEELWSFGFPLTALTVPLRALLYRRRLRTVEHLSREARVLRSSFDSTRQAPAAFIASAAVESVGLFFHVLQLGFLRTDLGASYLVACRRPALHPG